METEVVRYGNSRLTIARSGSLLADDELGRALERHEAGKAGPEEVAWAYVRTRTVEHSASFAWRTASLKRLIELVTGASAEPRIEATTPTGLAAYLVDERGRERGSTTAAPTPSRPETASAEAAPASTPAPQASTTPPAPVPAPAPKAAATTAPAPVAAAPATPEPRRGPLSRVGGLFPQRTLWRVVLGLGVVLAVAAFLGIRYYLNEVPDQLADDYREKAQPATEKVTDAMDRTFAAYDSYLANSTLPRSEIRNADEIDEIKRRFLPLYDDTEEALGFGARAIRDARKTIKKQRDSFEVVPTAPLLGEKDPVLDAKDTVDVSEKYLTEAERFLRNFDKFIQFEEKALALRRAETEDLGGAEISPDASIEEVKASLSSDLVDAKESREGYLDIEPHPDQAKLYDVYIEESTIAVDYLEDLLQAYNDLSITALRAADDEYLAASKPLRNQGSYLIGVFASKSSLQEQSRKLGRLGDDLEQRVTGLGTGDGNLVRPDRFRKPVPPLPPPPNGGGSPGSSEQGQQS